MEIKIITTVGMSIFDNFCNKKDVKTLIENLKKPHGLWQEAEEHVKRIKNV